MTLDRPSSVAVNEEVSPRLLIGLPDRRIMLKMGDLFSATGWP